ncbi:MAG: AI-2E family transporter [Clostridium sp.]
MNISEEYKRLISLGILFAIVAFVTFTLKSYFKPFFIVLVLVISATPVYNILNTIKVNKHIASFLSVLIINLLFIGIAIYFGNYIIEMVQNLIETNEEVVKDFLMNFRSIFDLDVDNFISTLSKFGGSSIIKEGAIMTGESLMSYFVANVFTFFFLVDKGKIYDFLVRIIPEKFLVRLKVKNKNLKQIVVVQGNLILVSALIMSIGFIMLRVDRPIFLAVFGAVIDILPYVGTIIVFIPIIIYNIVMKNYFTAIGFIILYILLIVVKEILEAKFLSSKLELHPLIVFLSIYIGLNIFGLLGMMIGPIYCMLAKDIIYNT